MIFRSEFDNFVNMKNLLTTLTVLVCLLLGGAEADATRRGDPEVDKCPMVILMHGIFSSGNIVPMPALARELAKAVEFFRDLWN